MHQRRSEIPRPSFLIGLTLSLALMLALASVFPLVAAFARTGVPAQIEEAPSIYGPKDPSFQAACREQLSALRTFRVGARVNTRDKLIDETTAGQSAATELIIPGAPERPDGRMDPRLPLYAQFLAYVHVDSLDLNNQIAQLDLAVAQTSGGRFPPDATATINVLSDTGATTTEPLSAGVLGKGLSRLHVQVPLSGDPTRYPEDNYEIRFRNPSLLVDVPGSDEVVYPLDLGNLSASQPALAAANIMAVPGLHYAGEGRRTCDSDASLVFERHQSPLFVWVVAAVPALFGLLTLHAIVEARQRDRRESASRTTAIEIAVAVLAVLPLRSVLVPSSLPSLTRVDYLLGAELVWLLALLVALQAVGQTRKDTQRPTTSELDLPS